MHLVFLNQYYPPDAAPTGVMLEAVVERLVADGHEVTVICAAGGYAGEVDQTDEVDRVDGPLRVVRLRATRFGRGTFVGKLVDYASFYAQVKWRLLRIAKPDRVVALTTPPYLSLLARVFSWIRGADHGHWVMDLYPDVMVAHGMLRERGLLHRALGWLTRLGFGGHRCAAIVTLGPDMAARVGRYAPAQAVSWVPLWATGEVECEKCEVRSAEEEAASPPQSPVSSDRSPLVTSHLPLCTSSSALLTSHLSLSTSLRQSRGWGEDELVVMYSGNMGLGHRFGEVLAAAVALAGEPVRFEFFGGGKRRGEIAAFAAAHPDCRIGLHDYAPAGELGAHLQCADVHLASLDPGWTGTMVPSKLQGIFAAGRPVIFIGDARSSIGQWITASGGGWTVDADDQPALIAAIHAARDPAERQRRGQAAAAFAATHFDRATNVAAVAARLEGQSKV
jgi:colanic acid biosynthesis glycosyl transferase WcaI